MVCGNPLCLLRHVDTQQDEYGAEESYVGDGLVEHGYRAEERHEGLGVHIVGGTDGAELLKHEIPRIEAEHGGHHGEEEHIAHHDRDSEQVEVETTAHACNDKGNHSDDAVEEDLARDEPCGVAAIETANDNTIDGPGKSGHKGESIAQRVYLEHGTIEYHEADTHEGYHGAYSKTTRDALAVDETGEQGREHGGDTHDKRHIGGDSIVDGTILGQEVEGATREAGQSKVELVGHSVGPELAREDPRQGIGDDETVEHNLGRSEPMGEQYLGRDERGAPHKNGDEGQYMVTHGGAMSR